MGRRLPWEVVETLPSCDPVLLAAWERRVTGATDDAGRARALVGRTLAGYWAVQAGVVDTTWDEATRQRAADTTEARSLARAVGHPDLVAEALLGTLCALWGPDHLHDRPAMVGELVELRPRVCDEELRLRILEWVVVGHLDAGDLAAARDVITRFATEAAGTDQVLFSRREELWQANLAMLEGRIDEAVATNQAAISTTAAEAGTPLSFQNVAITIAIERYLRRGLADVIESVRSIRASSPRVGANWTAGLAFSLAETGGLDEARVLFDELAGDDFAAVYRDLNWLVTMYLLGLTALHLEGAERAARLLELLRPFADRDATHGSGYASYGPLGRVVGLLAARCGHAEEARRCFDAALSTRAPGPWTSLTRLDRAATLEALDPEQAAVDARQAVDELRSFGMAGWARSAQAVVDRLELAGHGGPIAYRHGARWSLRHRTGSTSVPDAVGVRHLARLLERPGVAIAATDLAAPSALPAEGSSQTTLDAGARRAYRCRLAEFDGLDRELTASEAAERDVLRRELAGARYVRSSSAEVERARVRATKAIRRAIDAVAERSPGLGAHLAEAVSTGRRCVYAPSDGTAWRVIDA